MTSMTPAPAHRRVVIGVDTHKYVHVAVALNDLGGVLQSRSFSADRDGYYKAELIRGPARTGPWKTVEDVDLVRREVERSCGAIGKPVALIANYDGFYLDPGVSDTYFSMIAYLEKRYYSSASRYTTTAFMRLKHG